MAATLQVQEFALWDALKARRRPLSFEIEVTARCNLNCRHCYINLPAADREAEQRELSVPEISDLADQAVRLGAVWCLITGGEPLLRPDLAEIYMALKRRGLLLSVFTNATLLTEEHIRLLKRFPARDLEVTVYGVTRQTYERVTRRAGSFERFRRGLARLAEAGVRVRLKAMVLRSNLEEFPAMSAFGRAHTKDFHRFDAQLHLRFDGDPARNETIKSERLSPEQIAALDRGDEQRARALVKARSERVEWDRSKVECDRLFHCAAGNGSFVIGYDGQFRLCSSLWAPGTTFDLRRGTLAEAWNEHVPRVRELRSRRPQYLTTCGRCQLRDLCLWCPAHAHLETRAVDGVAPYFCEVAHARETALGPRGPSA